MKRNARNWRVAIGGVAAGTAAVIGFAGASASAEPVAPVQPAPATVTQTVTVMPEASSAVAGPTAISTPSLGRRRSAAPQPRPRRCPPSATAVAAPTAAAPTETLVPATSGTLAEFFKDKGVTMEPQKATGFTALSNRVADAPGWSVVPDPNVPDAFQVLADRQGGDGLYTSNAQLVVYKLVGDFDPKEAIAHGYVDSEKLANWQTTNASLADFGGFPSLGDRGHLPRERHDAEHRAAPRHRHQRQRSVPGVAVHHHGGQPGRRLRGRHRRHRQGLPRRRPRRPAAPAASPAAPAAAAPPAVVAAAPATGRRAPHRGGGPGVDPAPQH